MARAKVTLAALPTVPPPGCLKICALRDFMGREPPYMVAPIHVRNLCPKVRGRCPLVALWDDDDGG
jgi:hypothetical protein